MTDKKSITLGARSFDVPALPLRLNMKAYPLCRKLSGGSLIQRIAASGGSLDCTEEEMSDLVDLAFIGATAADSSIGREDFESLPVQPRELIDAFFAMRYQTGGWMPAPPQEEGSDTGEAQGARKAPRKSTSKESSQS